MRRIRIALFVAAVAAFGLVVGGARADPPAGGEELRPAAAFDGIADETERSRALFNEAAKVMLHPRCVNCHPAGDRPLQGEASTAHEPPVERGLGGTGVVGMRCRACHMRENFDPAGVPGAHQWALAPRKMAWEGFTVRQLCEQLQDPQRNGGRSLEEIVEHNSEDELVGWGWEPGTGRQPAPGDQELFGELIAAWAETGAACPE